MSIKRKDLITVGVLLFGTILTMLNQTALNPALPVIMSDFGVNEVTVQWLVSAYSLANAVTIPLSAYLLGRFSVKRLFLGALILFTAGTIIGAAAPGFWIILVGRIFQAVGAGITMPMMFSVILLTFPREKRGSAMGIVTLAMCFAPAIGPILSGLLLAATGWRGLFLVICCLALLIIAIGAGKIDTDISFSRTSFDKPSVFLCAAGLLSLLYGFSTFSSASNTAVTIALMALGILLLGAFVRRQGKLEVPLLKIDVLKVRDFRVAIIIAMILQGTLISLNVIMPLYIQNTMGYPPLVTGLAMMPGALLGGAASIVAGRLFDRIGVRKCVVPGIIFVFVGTTSLLLLDLDAGILFIALIYTIFPVAQHFTQTPMNTWGINSLDDKVIQHGNALTNTLNQVSASFMTALLMTVNAMGAATVPQASPQVQRLTGQHYAFGFLSVISLAAVLVIIIFVRDRRGEASGKAAFVRESLPAGGSITLGSSAGSVMNTEPYYLLDTATVADAIKMLIEKKTGGLPIVDEDKRIKGFITDGDIMKYLGRNDGMMFDNALMIYRISDLEPFEQRIEELMKLNAADIAASKVISIDEETPMEAACTLFSRYHIKKLPVTREGRLTGTLSRADVVRSTMGRLVEISEER